MSEKYLEIRLSRIPLAGLFIAGCLFVLAGIDIGFTHSIFPAFDIAPGKKWIFYLFLFFFIGGGGATAIQMALYLISPPVTFRASSEGVSFAAGFRYNLNTIPWKYVDRIDDGDMQFGLIIQFKNTKDIPGAMATSIGVIYGGYCLCLKRAYMDSPAGETKDAVSEIWKEHS